MKQLSSVVWHEGMALGPRHFQVQSRYIQDSVRFAVESLWFEAYGFLEFKLDPESLLLHSKVALTSASGFLPDGLAFEMPNSDPLPHPLTIEDNAFGPAQDSITIFLGIPADEPGRQTCTLDGSDSTDTRFIAEPKMIPDRNTGVDQKAIKFGRKNIRLLVETTDAKDVKLAVARVTRSGDSLVYDQSFIPPCLRVSASPRLCKLSEDLIDLLNKKLGSLSRGRTDPSGVATQDLEGFWFLFSLHSTIASLRHLYLTRDCHPEELFLALSHLGGALCTFSTGPHPLDLPRYDHRALGDCFERIEEHISLHIKRLLPQARIGIPLRPVVRGVYKGDVVDPRCLGRSRWVLGIRASALAAESVPGLVKVSSQILVEQLGSGALRGLTLTHISSPSPVLNPRIDYQYYEVSKDSDRDWVSIEQTKGVGVFVSEEKLPNPQPELSVLLGE
jgi:type VI secretion system protein ImpJ